MPEPEELAPDDVAAWIDERDPEPLPDATSAADRELDEQRAAHEREHGPEQDVAEDGVAPLINNTGLDGGAASG